MIRYAALIMLLPLTLGAQEFEFQFEPDSIPVTISYWQPFQPWIGGMINANPEIVDLDGDSNLDFVIGSDTYFKYLENSGNQGIPDFTYIPEVLCSLQTEGWTAPCLGDIDNDGDLDLFATSDERVWFWENVGTPQTPQWQFITDSLTQITWWAINLDLVDIDSDGDLDMFTGGGGPITFYRNQGTPEQYNFVQITMNFAGINVDGHADPCFVDIDADGDYDLFIGDAEGHIWFYRNDGTAQQYNFTYVTNNYFNIDVGDYASPEFADIDGDGDYDLFVGREPADYTNMRGDVFFYENVGNSTNAQFQLITNNYLTADLGYWSINPQVVDLNSDHAPDLLTGTGSTLTYFQNVGDSVNSSFSFVTEAFQGIYLQVIKPCLVDIDADGDLDLFAGEGVIPGPPTVALYLNRGTSQNPQFQLYSANFISNPNFFVNTNPVLADIDADGDYDLFITDDHGYFYYYQNIGSSTWPNFVLLTNQWITYNYPGWRPFCFGDLDEDGDLDLLMESLDQWNFCYYNNQGTPQAANMVLVTQEFLPGYDILAANPYLVDIDSDSDLDLFVGEGNGGILFFRNVTGQSPVDPRKRPTPTYPKIDLLVQPNPGNPASIVFSLPYPQEATLAVYNLLGARVATLASGLQPGGEQRFFWETVGKASGVYIVRLEAEQQVMARKMVLLK